MLRRKSKTSNDSKIVLPNSVTILGKTFKIIRNKRRCGAWFSGFKQIIEWNAEHQDDAEETLLHEVGEVILAETRHRYHKGGLHEQGDLLFVLTHDDYEHFITDLYASLKPFLCFAPRKPEKR